MKASIVIPTMNKLKRLSLVLHALESQINEDVEVIIVFDGCLQSVIDDFNKIHFSFSPVKIYKEKNIGRAAARNAGIKKARGEIIIFMDDDRIPCKGYVTMHINGHKEKCVLLGERKDIFLTDNEIEQLLNDDILRSKPDFIKSKILNKTMHQVIPFNMKRSLRWLNFYTGNTSVEKKDLEKAGCFDENFKKWGHEDLELGIRLYKEGIAFKENKDIVNYHILHTSNFDYNELKENSLENLKYMIRKYKKNIFISFLLMICYIKHKFVGLNIDRHDANEKKALI